MERRNFIKNAAVLAGSTALSKNDLFSIERNNRNSGRKLLNAYYFRAQMYTMVPHQIREDMKKMASIGTGAVSIAILEQDLFAAVQNIHYICKFAAEENMEVWAVPSRWGGLVAGAPKVPSLFSATHPQTWILRKNKKPAYNNVSGVISSIYHPETQRFFCESADKLLSEFPIKGLIWDEPKRIGGEDFSSSAQKILGNNSTYEARVQHHAEFFSSVNKNIRLKHPDVKTSLFIYANSDDTVVSKMAGVKELNYFGCDGRPWRASGAGRGDKEKTLVDNGERFLKAANDNEVQSLMLIENHNLLQDHLNLLEKGIPRVLAMHPDQLIYYYYPRNVEEPDRAMDIVFRQVRHFLD